MTEFTAHAAQCLQSSGWTADRRVDISTIIRELEAEGFGVSPAAADFLERFGGLRLSYGRAKDATVPDYSHLDPLRAADGVFPARLRDWESRAGERMTPIGESDREYMTILMGASGVVYLAMDDLLLVLADTGEEALNALCDGDDPKKTIP
jgi:hypothetical protein